MKIKLSDIIGYIAPVWGNITGSLSAQTDLNTALGGKEPSIAAGTTAQYWRGDKTWQPLPAPGIFDAPSDGNVYGRFNASWLSLAGIFAPLTGATFSGAIQAPRVYMDANSWLEVSSGNPLIVYNTGGNYQQFDRTNHLLNYYISGSITATFSTTGLSTPQVNLDANFWLQISSGNPLIVFNSGGNYLQFDRSANKLYLFIGGTAVMSVDASGNIRALGTITGSVTP